MVNTRWKIAVLAILMSILTWYLVTGRDLVETWVEFPLEIVNPPQGMIIRSGMISKVSARIRGPKGLIRNLDTKKTAYSLDTSGLTVGINPIAISADKLSLGSALEVVEVNPSVIKLDVDMYVKKQVEVIPRWKGELDRDYTLESKVADPAEITLRGPASILKKVTQVRTQTITLDSDTPQNWKGDVPLELPDEVEATPGTVSVSLDFAVKKAKMWVKVPLYILGPEEVDFTASQNFVRLYVEGPKPFFRKSGFRNEITASIDINGTIPIGKNTVPYDVSVPSGCIVTKKNPEKITVTISRQNPNGH